MLLTLRNYRITDEIQKKNIVAECEGLTVYQDYTVDFISVKKEGMIKANKNIMFRGTEVGVGGRAKPKKTVLLKWHKCSLEQHNTESHL